MAQLVGILGILLVFGLIIGFHEFGHFIVAKLTGMGVHEFSLGFGPALFSKRYRGTLYSVRAIPLGGFVRIVGEDGQEEQDAPNSFYKRPYPAKFATLLAGAFMNFVLAFLIFSVMFMAIGIQLNGKKTVITGVETLSPAAKAGLKAGDLIVEVNGLANLDGDQISEQIKQGKHPVTLTVERDGKRIVCSAEQKQMKTYVRRGWFFYPQSYYGIGIVKDSTSGQWQRLNPARAIVRGGVVTVNVFHDTVAQFLSLVTGKIKLKEISSFLGIGKVSYDSALGAVDSRIGLANYLGMIGMFSIAIGFFNLLPVPMLDGSRMLIVTIEAILRRQFNKEKEAMVHFAGLILLLGLVVYATFNDILRLTGKG